MKDNPYVPHQAEIVNVFEEVTREKNIKTIELEFTNDNQKEEFNFTPGQFVQISVEGVGEAPISINSSPFKEDSFSLCVERKGRVTRALFDLEEGSKVWIRGPYGEGFPLEDFKGKHLLFVAGGIGLAALRSAIEYVFTLREEYGEVQLMYGDKSANCLLFLRHFDKWGDHFDMHIICEEAGDEWTGEEGVVTDLLEKAYINPQNGVTLTCGPPIMYKFVIPKIQGLGFADEDIFLSLERRMECGVGHCRRCNVGEYFVCQDGPVFSYDEIKPYFEKET